jgi:hypothetical protein
LHCGRRKSNRHQEPDFETPKNLRALWLTISTSTLAGVQKTDLR